MHLKEVRLRLWVFSFKAHPRKPIALATVACDEAVGVWVGSAGNVFGFAAERALDGWVPSTPMGLAELGRLGREADLDAAMTKILVPTESWVTDLMGDDPPDLVNDAVFLATMITRTPDLDLRVELLAKVHAYRDDQTVFYPMRPSVFVKRAVVGAPVFIRGPEPRPVGD